MKKLGIQLLMSIVILTGCATTPNVTEDTRSTDVAGEKTTILRSDREGIEGVRPGSKPKEGVVGAYINVDSNPRGATVLIGGRDKDLNRRQNVNDVEYGTWVEAEGQGRTPTRALVPLNTSFWLVVKSGRKISDPVYVEVDSTIAQNIFFDMTKNRQQASTVDVTISSSPAGATLLVSGSEFGAYQPWPIRGGKEITPIRMNAQFGRTLWIKMRLDGFRSSKPHRINTNATEPLTIHHRFIKTSKAVPSSGSVLSASAVAMILNATMAAADDVQTITVSGTAPINDNKAHAREVAVNNALSNALDEYLGDLFTTTGFEAKADRVSFEKDKYINKITTVEEGTQFGVYRVKLDVQFKVAAVKQLMAKEVSFLVGGKEKLFEELGRGEDSLQARRAVSDALMEGAMAVTINEDTVSSAITLANLAGDNTEIKYQADVVLHIDARTELVDKFGGFKFETTIEYQVLIPMMPTEYRDAEFSHLIANGIVTASARGPRASAATRDSLRKAGEEVARVAIEKMLKRFDRAAMHDVYIVGYINQRDQANLLAELGDIDGVSEVKSMFFSESRSEDAKDDLHQYQLIMAPNNRKSVAHAVARIVELPSSVEVVETDLYSTVAYAKVSEKLPKKSNEVTNIPTVEEEKEPTGTRKKTNLGND